MKKQIPLRGGNGASPVPDASDVTATIPASAPVGRGKGADITLAGGHFSRHSLHASGGMGRVWLARDLQIGRDVAIKELRAEVAPEGTERFLREARITGQLQHPGIVPVYELGADPVTGRPFYAMRFVRGRTLTEVAELFHSKRCAGNEDALELVNLLTAFVSVCNTVAYAHSNGVIHRDLKGENIVLGDFGEVIVLDWGLAKRLNDPDEAGKAKSIPPTPEQTAMGQVMGTPAYMAPEQAEGRQDQVGTWTDIFGLGAILYEILTGQPPFFGDATQEVLQQALRADIAPPRTHWPEVPQTLADTCMRAMARLPSDRHSSAVALAHEVQGWQDKQRRQAEDELRHASERLRSQQAALVKLTYAKVFAGPDLNATFRQMIEMAARTLGVERVSIWRFTEDRRRLHCHALYELSLNRHSAGTELNAQSYPRYFEALATSEVIAATDARTDPRTSEFTEGYLKPLGIGAMMEVPVHPDGVLCHEHVGPPRSWLPDEQLFGIAVGHLAAHAISQWERCRALEQLHKAAGATP